MSRCESFAYIIFSFGFPVNIPICKILFAGLFFYWANWAELAHGFSKASDIFALHEEMQNNSKNRMVKVPKFEDIDCSKIHKDMFF